MPAFDLTTLQIGDLVTSGKGAKTAPFTCGGKPAIDCQSGAHADSL